MQPLILLFWRLSAFREHGAHATALLFLLHNQDTAWKECYVPPFGEAPGASAPHALLWLWPTLSFVIPSTGLHGLQNGWEMQQDVTSGQNGIGIWKLEITSSTSEVHRVGCWASNTQKGSLGPPISFRMALIWSWSEASVDRTAYDPSCISSWPTSGLQSILWATLL